MGIKRKIKKYGFDKRGREFFALARNPFTVLVVGLLYLAHKCFKKIYKRKERAASNKKLTYVLGFSPWKAYVKDWFPERELVFLKTNITFVELVSELGFLRVLKKDYEIFQWGFKVGDDVEKGLGFLGVKRWIIEDGFVRSIGLGATKTPPFSLSIDSKTAYFDASKESDLEQIISSYDFSSDVALMERARAFKEKLVSSGLSKYNFAGEYDIESIYGAKNKKRVLVVGQVEDDASIQYGCNKVMTNNDLVTMAALENPDAQIIYKPHPDVLHGHRKAISSPENVKSFALVLEDLSVPLAESFKTIDHVYTITSQAGFEALLRGIKVTTVGCPFYSGWGLTDDRQKNARRNRKLSVDEIFAAAYILYPKYFDPIDKKPISPEEALDKLLDLKQLYSNADVDEIVIEDNVVSNEAGISDFESVKEYLAFKKVILELEEELVDKLESGNINIGEVGD